MSVSLCIATHRRNEQLRQLLDDMVAQTLSPAELVVVDNTAEGGAREVVEQRMRYGTPFQIRYEVQPIQNISLTRNRTVDLATGSWIAFIDDDERAQPPWLELMLATAERYRADVVLGPVEPMLPPQAPPWIRRGSFYNWPRMTTGTVVPANLLRFGNVLMRSELLKGDAPPFDPAYGLTGGEDGAMLTRLARRGARIVWCDEAAVVEPVAPTRLSLRWLCLRALRGGQDFSRHTLDGGYGAATHTRTTLLALRSLAQMLVAGSLVPLTLPLGRHQAAHWIIKATANFGKLSLLCGWRYDEYARRTSP
ncbi:glycosyltransferase family 2 protein [Nevskia soli]|uniref:glycosyltransferase family 2 protein n=1 Tax=Nevskia soli TaxID=418856 RepID=UPI0004A6F344|nr:glycosyltransferase family 2 protein [Nevskia soli]